MEQNNKKNKMGLIVILGIIIICVIGISIFFMNKNGTENNMNTLKNTYNQDEKSTDNKEVIGPKEPEEELGEMVETPSEEQ